jgi:flavin-dependent dehydrogenase
MTEATATQSGILPAGAQRPAADCQDRLWDVIVVGAGPAGGLAALRLAAAGARVLQLERAELPREKVCGDALLPDALTILERNGCAEILKAGRPLTALAVYSPAGRRVEFPCRAVTLRRQEFDARLAAAARAAGAELARGEALACGYDAAGLPYLTCRDGSRLRGRFLLLACGAAPTPLLRPVLPARRTPDALALRCYLHSALPLDELIVSYHRSVLPGYGWIFPLGDGLFNVGCGRFAVRGSLRGLRRAFATFLEGFAPARELVAQSRERGPLRGAPLRTTPLAVPPWDGRRVLVAGEALGTTLPWTGEGVGKALACGELAAGQLLDALAAGAPAPLAGYRERLLATVIAHHDGYRHAQDWLSRPWRAELLAWRAAHSPRLRGMLADLLAGTTAPPAVFTTAALLRSMWS